MTEFITKADIKWTPDCDGVHILNSETWVSHRLTIREGIVWDILCQFDDRKIAIKLSSAILGIPADEANTFVTGCCQRWQSDGLLEE
jgi:hypothetical protein